MAEPDAKSFIALMDTAELADLGPGPRPGVELEGAIEEKLRALFEKSKIPMRNQGLIRALILLWHDHLESAHRIAQDIETADGSFVHGIMHRREPDYGNAKYWFRRVGSHPAFAQLAERSSSVLEEKRATPLHDQLIGNGQWDAMRFVDACEEAARKGKSAPEYQLLRRIQQIESETLIETFCSRGR